MCGRYAQGRAVPELLERYVALGPISIAEQQFAPRYNIAPSTEALVLFRDAGGTHLAPMRWGFVPHWAKALDQLKQKPINAQSEKADTTPFFRDAFRSHRCIVPAEGFYEWQGAKPPKQPWFIHTRAPIMSLAGLWSHRLIPDAGELYTFTILTTSANAFVSSIHDRMPCILRPDQEKAWLDAETDKAALKEMLAPYPAEEMAAHRVSTAVNTPRSDGPELMQPLPDLFA